MGQQRDRPGRVGPDAESLGEGGYPGAAGQIVESRRLQYRSHPAGQERRQQPAEAQDEQEAQDAGEESDDGIECVRGRRPQRPGGRASLHRGLLQTGVKGGAGACDGAHRMSVTELT